MKSSFLMGSFLFLWMLDCGFDFVSVGDSTPNTKRQTIFDTGFDYVLGVDYGIINKEVEILPKSADWRRFVTGV